MLGVWGCEGIREVFEAVCSGYSMPSAPGYSRPINHYSESQRPFALHLKLENTCYQSPQ